MKIKLMLSLPDRLVSRMKATIPSKERNKVLSALLEIEIRKREQKIYACAKDLEQTTYEMTI